MMTTKSDWQAVAVFYRPEDTEVGTDLYGNIQCFEGKLRDDEPANPFRISAPFVVARWHGYRQVVPGSVCGTLSNIRALIRELAQSTARMDARLEQLPRGPEKAALYDEYEREIANCLILVSCLLRNVFDIFPESTAHYFVPIFDYEGKQVEEIKMRVLLNLLVHNRHMSLSNEFITNLFSDRLPAGTAIAEKFMGCKFKMNDFLGVVQDAVHAVTVKDLAERLRSNTEALTAHTPHHEMVFLIQNISSLSDLLHALIPTRGHFLMNLLFPGISLPAEVTAAAEGRLVTVTHRFRIPSVRLGNRVDADNKKIVVSGKGEFHYTVNEREVHSESADCKKEIDYREFFDCVVAAAGDDSLLATSDRREERATSSA